MKSFAGIVALIVSSLALVSALGEGVVKPQCSVSSATTPDKWVTMGNKCINGVKKQIQKEIAASYAYLEMGAYFSRDTVNRPGFAELYFSAAKEEREHGIKLIEYLSMRGELTALIGNLITVPVRDHNFKFAAKDGTTDGQTSLKAALDLESRVTDSIRDLIKACEDDSVKRSEAAPAIDSNDPLATAASTANDYHLVDYLSGVYLEEQYKGQRDIAGKYLTLSKMQKGQGAALAEFLFDKQLLEQFN